MSQSSRREKAFARSRRRLEESRRRLVNDPFGLQMMDREVKSMAETQNMILNKQQECNNTRNQLRHAIKDLDNVKTRIKSLLNTFKDPKSVFLQETYFREHITNLANEKSNLELRILFLSRDIRLHCE